MHIKNNNQNESTDKKNQSDQLLDTVSNPQTNEELSEEKDRALNLI